MGTKSKRERARERSEARRAKSKALETAGSPEVARVLFGPES